MTQIKTSKTYSSLRRDRAVCLLKNFLKTSKIPFTKSNIANSDFTVARKSGGTLEVKVVGGANEALPEVSDENLKVVAANELLTTDYDPQEAFWVVTEAAGYGKPVSVNRGVAPATRGREDVDIHLTVMRHREFRRAPDLSKETFNRYKSVVKNMARYFYNSNHKRLKRVGLDMDDLVSYGYVLMTNHLAQFDFSDKSVAETQKLLGAYLKQRFVYIIKRFESAEENIHPNYGIVKGALFEITDLDGVHSEPETRLGLLEEPGYDRRRCQLDRSSEGARAKSAKDLLVKLLDGLGHDTMVEKLQEVIENSFASYAARATAVRYLKKHAKDCATCKAGKVQDALEEQEVALELI